MKQQIHLLVHQGHMRLLVPRELDRRPPIIREVIAARWECHLEAAAPGTICCADGVLNQKMSHLERETDLLLCWDSPSALMPVSALVNGHLESSKPRTYVKTSGPTLN